MQQRDTTTTDMTIDIGDMTTIDTTFDYNGYDSGNHDHDDHKHIGSSYPCTGRCSKISRVI